MEVLLIFFLGIFVTSMRSANRPVHRWEALSLLLGTLIVSLALMSHRLA